MKDGRSFSQGEWVVWNARSKMMVASGSWNDLLLAEEALRFKEMPIVLRTQVDLEAIGVEKADKPSVGLVSRGGEKASIEVNGFKLGVEVTSAIISSGLIDAALQVSWPADLQDSRWEITTAAILEDGKRLRLARQGGWELFATVTSELTDGTPWREARWQETKVGLTRWPQVEGPTMRMRKTLDQRRSLGLYDLPRDAFSQWLSEPDAKKRPEVTAPPEISDWVRGPLVDMRDFLRSQGLKLDGAEHFAGFDPASGGLFIITDELNQDLSEQLFHALGPCCVEQLWIETNLESGGWGLICRSGERARISRTGAQETSLAFDIEPTTGADGATIDLHCTLDVASGEKSFGKLESKTTLMKDKPQVIGSGSITAEDEVKVIVTASDPRE